MKRAIQCVAVWAALCALPQVWAAGAAGRSVADALMLLGRLPASVREPAIRFATDPGFTIEELDAELSAAPNASFEPEFSQAEAIRLANVGEAIDRRSSGELLFGTAKRLARLKERLLASPRVPESIKEPLGRSFETAYDVLHGELRQSSGEKAQLMADILTGQMRGPSDLIDGDVSAAAASPLRSRSGTLGLRKRQRTGVEPYVNAARLGPDIDEETQRDADRILDAIWPTLESDAQALDSETRAAIRDLSESGMDPIVYESHLPRALIEAGARRGLYVWLDEMRNTGAYRERLTAERLPGRTLLFKIGAASRQHPFVEVHVTNIPRIDAEERGRDRAQSLYLTSASADAAYVPIRANGSRAPTRAEMDQLRRQMEGNRRNHLLLLGLAIAAAFVFAVLRTLGFWV